MPFFHFMIPDELKPLDNCFRVPIESFVPGIYFLYLKGEMMYIGQALNVFLRLATHKQEKEFDECYFFPCLKENLSLYESTLIKYFRPPLNKSTLRMSLRTANVTISSLLKLPLSLPAKSDDLSNHELVSANDALQILGVNRKILKRLTDFGDITLHRVGYGRMMYYKTELEEMRRALMSLHIPLQNEK